jgi:hypothetical protein
VSGRSRHLSVRDEEQCKKGAKTAICKDSAAVLNRGAIRAASAEKKENDTPFPLRWFKL